MDGSGKAACCRLGQSSRRTVYSTLARHHSRADLQTHILIESSLRDAHFDVWYMARRLNYSRTGSMTRSNEQHTHSHMGPSNRDFSAPRGRQRTHNGLNERPSRGAHRLRERARPHACCCRWLAAACTSTMNSKLLSGDDVDLVRGQTCSRTAGSGTADLSLIHI